MHPFTRTHELTFCSRKGPSPPRAFIILIIRSTAVQAVDSHFLVITSYLMPSRDLICWHS